MATQKCSGSKGSRSSDKAYIALIGMTGAGKSSTLNALFDRNALGNTAADDQTQTKFDSNTQEVIEYKVSVPVPNDTQLTQELIVIDTPGFHDNAADFRQKDSRIMATTELYLVKHNELKSCYPTAVLLVVDFQDESINDEDSYFVDFLKALEELIDNYTLIDTGSQTCNLVLVLTKYMNARKEHQQYPEQQVRLLRGLIRAFTSIPPNFPVVFAENMGKAFKLPEELGYFKLPTGDLYPFNLFRAIQNIAIRSEDSCGANIIANAFSNPLQLQKHKVHAENLLPADDTHCLKYYYIDENNFQENDITKMLEKYWKEQASELTTGFGIFLKVAKAVFIGEGIEKESDMPKETNQVLKLLQQLPVHPALEYALRKLDVTPPLIWESARKIGCFYNITGDSATSVVPFVQKTKKITQVGFEAPDFLQADIVSNLNDKTFKVVHKFPTREAYVSNRLSCLKVDFDSDKQKNFDASALPGHNIFSANDTPEEITGLVEFREYYISLVTDLTLRTDYVDKLKELPQTYLNYTNQLQQWGSHFTGHGTHCIQGAFLGGYVKVTAKRRDDVTKRATADDVFETIKLIIDNLGVSENFTKHKLIEGWVFDLEYSGGDLNLYKPPLNKVFTVDGIQEFVKWRDSLKNNPILLTSQLLVEHISEFLKVEHATLSETVSTAANYCIGCCVYKDYDKPVERQYAGSYCTIL